MATPENQINGGQAAQLQQMLQGIDTRWVNMTLSALSIIPGAKPLILSETFSPNAANICRYGPVERMETTVKVMTLQADSLEDIDVLLNDAKQNEADEVNILSELRFMPGKDSFWIQQIEIVTTKPTGEFDPAIMMVDGEVIILSPEENDIFRESWMQQAVLFNDYLSLAAELFPLAATAETGDAGSAGAEITE